jgi:serine/threonine-protein kinase PknK
VLNRLVEQARADTWPAGFEPIPAERLAPLAPAPPDLLDLGGREVAILRMLDSGCTNQQIARKLAVTVNTVKWYLKGIYAKLDAANRTEAVSVARRLGLIG